MLLIRTGFFFSLLLFNLSHVFGDDLINTIVSNDAQSNFPSDFPAAFQTSTTPFYNLMNIFLQTLQPASSIQLDTIYLYGLFLRYNSSASNSQSQLRDNIFETLKRYVGYVILFLVGLLFLLVLPIVGIFFCCCRLCCARCGNQIKAMDHKNSRCRRNTFGIILGILTTIMLFGIVIMFINNSLFRVALTNEQSGLAVLVKNSLSNFSFFVQEATDDLQSNAHNVMSNMANQIKPITENSLSAFSDNLLADAEINLAFDGISALDSNFTKISVALTFIKNRRSSYTALYNDLKTNQLVMLQKNLSSEFDLSGGTLNFLGVSSDLVIETKSLIDQLRVTQRLDMIDFDDVESVLNNANYSNLNISTIETSLRQAENSMQNVQRHAYDVIAPQVNSVVQLLNSTAQLDGLLQNAVGGLSSLSSMLDNVSLALKSFELATPTSKGQSLKSALMQYEEVRFYVFVAMGAVCLVIIASYYLGLFFGCCGEPPYEDAGLCNRDVGANLLMTGVALSFILGWLIMLLVMLFFFPGALLYTESCRYLKNETANGNGLLLLDQALQNVTLSNPSMVSGILASSSGGIVSGILKECASNNVTLLNVLQLQSSIDLKNLTSQCLPFINEAYKNLLGINFRQYVTVYPDVMLNELKKAVLAQQLIVQLAQSAALASSITELQSVVYVYPSLINNLDSIINKLSDETSLSKKVVLKALLDTLNSLVNRVELEAAALSSSFLVVQTTQLRLADVVEQLSVSNNSLLASSYIKRSSDVAISYFKLYFDELLPVAVDKLLDVKDCINIHAFARDIVNIVCKSMLNPFNSLWFGLGWFLLFVIPALIFAVKLNNLYRKAIKYEKEYDDKPTGISFYAINEYEC